MDGVAVGSIREAWDNGVGSSRCDGRDEVADGINSGISGAAEVSIGAGSTGAVRREYSDAPRRASSASRMCFARLMSRLIGRQRMVLFFGWSSSLAENESSR